LFMIDTSCLEYLQANYNVLVIDSTYKIHQFGLPLLDIISKFILTSVGHLLLDYYPGGP